MANSGALQIENGMGAKIELSQMTVRINDDGLEINLMGEPILTIGGTVQCSHSGTASITPSQQRVKIAGEAVALISDTTTVSGCSFQVPIVVGTKAQPCVKVSWLSAATRVRTGGQLVLLQSSSGLCTSGESIPQGSPDSLPSSATCKRKLRMTHWQFPFQIDRGGRTAEADHAAYVRGFD